MRALLCTALLLLPLGAASALASDPNPGGCLSTANGAPVDCMSAGIAGSARPIAPGVLVPWSGTPVPSSVSSVGSTPVELFPALGVGQRRLHLSIANGNAAGGATLDCTWDGTTPSKTVFDFVVFAGGYTPFDPPGFVSNGSVMCVEPDATTPGPIKAETK